MTEALRLFTADGAYASFEENIKGCIKAGMLADFTVLGTDPFSISETEVHAIRICGTFVAGKATQRDFTF